MADLDKRAATIAEKEAELAKREHEVATAEASLEPRWAGLRRAEEALKQGFIQKCFDEIAKFDGSHLSRKQRAKIDELRHLAQTTGKFGIQDEKHKGRGEKKIR